MSISEFKIRLNLITCFINKMSKETIPCSMQRIMLKIYASTLKIHLTDKMVEEIM